MAIACFVSVFVILLGLLIALHVFHQTIDDATAIGLLMMPIGLGFILGTLSNSINEGYVEILGKKFARATCPGVYWLASSIPIACGTVVFLIGLSLMLI